MLYLQGLNNLQLGNVANYLEPIVQDPNEHEDLKFNAHPRTWTCSIAILDVGFH